MHICVYKHGELAKKNLHAHVHVVIAVHRCTFEGTWCVIQIISANTGVADIGRLNQIKKPNVLRSPLQIKIGLFFQNSLDIHEDDS